MSVWTDFENQRDEIYCGRWDDEPERYEEAEIGAKYKLYNAGYGKVEKIVTCTAKNKEEIEKSLNDNDNFYWWYEKVE